MSLKSIDAAMLQKMFLSGAKALEAKKEYINELNVFPVPDGDTGTNMTMTVMAAAREVKSLENPTIEQFGKSVSSGSLRGARGNSGVIMSQIFRGFVKSIKGLDELDVNALSNAIQHASDTAYKAVMKPKEGTILTVARAGADRAIDIIINDDMQDIIEFCDAVAQSMEEALLKTPELLPVLKQAGVVDSGGEGLMTFLRGAIDALKGKVSDFSIKPGKDVSKVSAGVQGTGTDTLKTTAVGGTAEADIKFGYCTEFIIMLERDENVVEQQLKEYLQKIGDCVVVVADDGIVKVHVHTNDPGLAIQKALSYGSLTSMKIDNMREEHNEKVIRDAEKLALADEASNTANAKQVREESDKENSNNKENNELSKEDDKLNRTNTSSKEENTKENIKSNKESTDNNDSQHKRDGFIAVAAGKGITEIFYDLKADYVIEGGQTMNPSTDDILNAINSVDADNIFVLPNNGNIILAAEQAKELAEDKNVIVIPSKNVPQGIAALINYSSEHSVEDNEKNMSADMLDIKTGQITYAVRDTNMNGKEIKKGDFIGLTDKQVISVDKTADGAAKALVGELIDADSELVGIYYGADMTEADAEKLADEIIDEYEGVEVEIQYGGQPVYSYYISVE